MIDRLVRSLVAAFPELQGEQLMDVLWLAAKYRIPIELSTPESESADTGVAGSDAEDVEGSDHDSGSTSTGADLALPDDEQRTAASAVMSVTEVGLRVPVEAGPLPTTVAALSQFRRVHRPGPPVVDVEATVEATADAQRLVVITRPSQERGLDVAIVVDRTPVATVWADTVDEFEATLRRTGAFRSVTRWSLDGTENRAEPVTTLVLRDGAGTAHSTDFIIDPAGRRLVLLLTDGASPRWYTERVWHMIGRWARLMPTGMVHLLPRSYWGYTATGQPTAAIRSRRPATPNSEAEVRTSWWSDDPARTDVPVPIITMRPEDIARWAHAVVTGSTWTDAVWARPPDRTTAVPSTNELTSADRVRAFESRASVGAQDLARVLASAPLLSLPLIHALHEHLVHNAETEQLAELLVSGLLETLPDRADGSANLLRFRPGVADLLYQGTTASQEWDVFDVLTRHLERNASSGNTIRAVLADPHGTASVEGDLVPFAAMGRSVARRLGIAIPAEVPDVGSGASAESDESVGIRDEEQAGVDIVVLFDGAWNDKNDNTNVSQIYKRISKDPHVKVSCHYLLGVGSRPLERLRGGIFGSGLGDNIRDGYRFIASRHGSEEGRIFLFGYSRGAFCARSLAGMIAKCGVVSPQRISAEELFDRYRDSSAPGLSEMRQNHALARTEADKKLLDNSRLVRIRFIGVFDTVGPLGIPSTIGHQLARRRYEFHDTNLSGLVDYAYHAVAIDEHRKEFAPTLWTGVPKPQPGHTTVVEQRWFAGAHANVGGGGADIPEIHNPLSVITREWIIDRAAHAGLKISSITPIATAWQGAISDSWPSRLQLAPGNEPYLRPVRGTINSTLDASVLQRWGWGNPSYKPRNPGLADWVTHSHGAADRT